MSYAYRYLRRATAAAARPEFAPYIVNPASGYAYQDFKKSVPLSAWDVEASPPRRLAVGFLENNVAGGLVDGRYWPPPAQDNVGSSSPREWLFIFGTTYSETPNPDYQRSILDFGMPIWWFIGAARRGEVNFSPGGTGEDQFLILANHVNVEADVFEFTAPAAVKYDPELAKLDASRIGVFPNPYYAFNAAETNRFNRFVTFTNLPSRATIRIFNLAGQLVRTIRKDTDVQYQRWDLLNESGFPVASGMYIAHIDLPDVGTTKVLKMAIIQEQEILDTY